jgi:hypothetical protein
MIKTLLKILSKEQFGFIYPNDLTVLEKEMPNLPVLMRFGASREVADACMAKTIMSEKEAAGDYIRDVSIPSRVLDAMYEGRNYPLEVRKAIQELRA